jgi:hypothetical protein
MAGNATGRAVSSMNAMLDPSMVAASTHGAAFGAQTECACFESDYRFVARLPDYVGHWSVSLFGGLPEPAAAQTPCAIASSTLAVVA